MALRLDYPREIDLGLTVLRIVTGIVFAMHGYQKFFVMGIDGTTGFFTQIGVPLPGITAILIATLELVGGLAFAAGLGTRVVGILLAMDMMGSIIFFHAKNGFFLPTGIEFVLMLMTSAIALALAGPGAYSLDAMLGSKNRRTV